MIGAGEDDAFDAAAARRLEDVVAALDIERQHLLPFGLRGLAGQMHDAVDAGRRPLDRRNVADVGCEDFLALLGGAERRNVEQTNERIGAAQALRAMPCRFGRPRR